MFYCSGCGYKSIKWLGKCPLCGGWETFTEEREETSKERFSHNVVPPKLLKDITTKDLSRITAGLNGLDRILGGGLIKGEVILVGGEPGIGKSTLLLDVASKISKEAKTLYVSAEESPQQVGIRAKRLGGDFSKLYILGEDNLKLVYRYVKDSGFKFLVVDSIQTVNLPESEGVKGSVSQIRVCADYLTQIAKSLNIVVFIVGHVTKEGAIAGPKLLEHIVDCVLYFEGDSLSNYRILRTNKNRFGPAQDFAVWEMTSYGLKEVKKTTDIFLPHRESSVSGSCVVCVIEGTRPVLIELQSLVSRATFGMVRRRSIGFDFNRFSLLVAIIEKRLKISLSSEDVFLNVAGGLKVTDPSADLGAVIAIISSYKDKDVSLKSVFIGEVGLGGELRRVNNINLRLKEIARAGFNYCIVPEANMRDIDKGIDIKLVSCASLIDAVKRINI